jgi:hypothetical protein
MKTALALLCLSLTLVSCGKDPGVSSGNCKEDVIRDYNSMTIRCQNLNEYNYKQCRSEVRSFLDHYPSVECQALDRSTGGEMTIRHSEIEAVLRQLETLR